MKSNLLKFLYEDNNNNNNNNNDDDNDDDDGVEFGIDQIQGTHRHTQTDRQTDE